MTIYRVEKLEKNKLEEYQWTLVADFQLKEEAENMERVLSSIPMMLVRVIIVKSF